MAWVTRIRECRRELVVANPEAEGLRHGPVLREQRRICVLVPRASIERVVGRRLHTLPEHRGAGPCGTYAHSRCGSLAWSITHLVEPLAAYYATYTPPLRFGAKIGPRGRRAA